MGVDTSLIPPNLSIFILLSLYLFFSVILFTLFWFRFNIFSLSLFLFASAFPNHLGGWPGSHLKWGERIPVSIVNSLSRSHKHVIMVEELCDF